jgi:hypothetical protein
MLQAFNAADGALSGAPEVKTKVKPQGIASVGSGYSSNIPGYNTRCDCIEGSMWIKNTYNYD